MQEDSGPLQSWLSIVRLCLCRLFLVGTDGMRM
jgi:hypothetical protein